jgi:hypothetical protein
MCSPIIEKFGATPANIQWTVVRGDTATFRVDFLENDEITFFDTSNWTYKATAYDKSGDFLDELIVEDDENGYVIVKATADLTANWGSAYRSVVAELPFDLQVKIVDGSDITIWSPVIGTICVLGDVTPGGSL